jgi:hypothetical protein
MKKIGRILPGALGRDEVLETARAQAILRRWDEIVGPQLAIRSKPDRYDNGTVWVSVEGSAWAQELRMMSEVILQKLEIMAGKEGLFKQIRFGVRPIGELPTKEEETKKPAPNLEHLKELPMQEIIRRRLEILSHEGDS